MLKVMVIIFGIETDLFGTLTHLNPRANELEPI